MLVNTKTLKKEIVRASQYVGDLYPHIHLFTQDSHLFLESTNGHVLYRSMITPTSSPELTKKRYLLKGDCLDDLYPENAETCLDFASDGVWGYSRDSPLGFSSSDFPETKSLIPSTFSATIKVQNLGQTLKALPDVHEEFDPSKSIKITAGKSKTKIRLEESLDLKEGWSVSTIMNAHIVGSVRSFAVRYEYLLKLADTFGGDEIVLRVNGPEKPVCVLHENAIALAMPVRKNNNVH